MNVLWLGDPKSFNPVLVGGKMANLSRLSHVYDRVPDGFSLPATVLNEAHPLDLRTEVEQAVAAMIVRPADVEYAYAQGELYLLQCRPVTT